MLIEESSVVHPSVQIIYQSAVMQNLLNAIKIVSSTDATVLITGESGTGKEVIARYIHQYSRRASRGIHSINCAAIPEGIAESELFGHSRGAYTGAHTNYAGKIRMAHGGTLFFDEVSELALSIQGKLLRFIENNECQSVGEYTTYHPDVRIICASNKRLEDLCSKKQFREDLYYRLNVVPFNIPPLRDRKEDILLLLDYFCNQYAQQYKLPPIYFSEECIVAIEKYTWPGNIRELKNFCERMTILFQGQKIEPSNLPVEFSKTANRSINRLFQLPPEGINLVELEKHILNQAMEHTDGNFSQAARLLGLSRHSFSYRYKKHGLQ